MVSIPLERYKELIKTETRAGIILELIAAEKAISSTTIAYILGNPELAFELEEESRRYWAKKEGRQ